MDKKCIICGKMKQENLVILGKAICADCEWQIVTTRVHDEGYRDYIKAVSRAFERNKGA